MINSMTHIIYVLSVMDILGFAVLSTVFMKLKDDYGALLGLLFAASAMNNIFGAYAIVGTGIEHVTIPILGYATSRLFRVVIQLLLLGRILGLIRQKKEDSQTK